MGNFDKQSLLKYASKLTSKRSTKLSFYHLKNIQVSLRVTSKRRLIKLSCYSYGYNTYKYYERIRFKLEVGNFDKFEKKKKLLSLYPAMPKLLI